MSAVVVVALGMAGSSSCERGRDGNVEPRGVAAANLDAATIIDGGAGIGVPHLATADARDPVAADHSVAWRKALDEVVRRIDRGERLERVAAVLGTVTKGADGQILIESAQPWASSVTLSVRERTIHFLFNTHLVGAEVNAGAGPCHLDILLGDFGDGQGVTCPDIETRRGTMYLYGTTEPWNERALDQAIVDTFAFYWKRRR